MDPLSSAKNNFFLGNFEIAINEALALQADDAKLRQERDVLLYRAYIGKGDYDKVISDVNDGSSVGLQAVQVLAMYHSGDHETALAVLEELSKDGNFLINEAFHIVSATIYMHEGRYEDALRSLVPFNTVERCALAVQALLMMERIDAAEGMLGEMQKISDYDILTQLATAWVFAHQGADELRKAFLILDEIASRYGRTAALANAMATVQLHSGEYADAERMLMEALQKDGKNADVLANLVACYQHLDRPAEVAERYRSQLAQVAPGHALAKRSAAAREALQAAAASYAPTNAV